ncbi:hypothetical protein BZG36_03622 [Bifiguratus adelaidae]|uniref:PHD-type domain-containing protein n=1 Tax=Bifiguratus adelaidae TaxID=1938954 RepID=A0A261Y068_9FUNG|nr:hypothetical protein BZG36_03622 [Bifiguratus adelaidae]
MQQRPQRPTAPTGPNYGGNNAGSYDTWNNDPKRDNAWQQSYSQRPPTGPPQGYNFDNPYRRSTDLYPHNRQPPRMGSRWDTGIFSSLKSWPIPHIPSARPQPYLHQVAGSPPQPTPGRLNTKPPLVVSIDDSDDDTPSRTAQVPRQGIIGNGYDYGHIPVPKSNESAPFGSGYRSANAVHSTVKDEPVNGRPHEDENNRALYVHSKTRHSIGADGSAEPEYEEDVFQDGGRITNGKIFFDYGVMGDKSPQECNIPSSLSEEGRQTSSAVPRHVASPMDEEDRQLSSAMPRHVAFPGEGINPADWDDQNTMDKTDACTQTSLDYTSDEFGREEMVLADSDDLDELTSDNDFEHTGGDSFSPKFRPNGLMISGTQLSGKSIGSLTQRMFSYRGEGRRTVKVNSRLLGDQFNSEDEAAAGDDEHGKDEEEEEDKDKGRIDDDDSGTDDERWLRDLTHEEKDILVRPCDDQKREWLEQWKDDDPSQCCICLDDQGEGTWQLVYCEMTGCDVALVLVTHSVTWTHLSAAGARPYYVSHQNKWQECVLCPQKHGLFKKLAKDSVIPGYVHHICAQWMPEVLDRDQKHMDEWDISAIPGRNWEQTCYICKDPKGACIRCDAYRCDKWFHVTCAQAWSTLEVEDDKNMANPYFPHCKEHSTPDDGVVKLNDTVKWIEKRDKFLQEDKIRRGYLRQHAFSQKLREIPKAPTFVGLLESMEDQYVHYLETMDNEIRRLQEAVIKADIRQRASSHSELQWRQKIDKLKSQIETEKRQLQQQKHDRQVIFDVITALRPALHFSKKERERRITYGFEDAISEFLDRRVRWRGSEGDNDSRKASSVGRGSIGRSVSPTLYRRKATPAVSPTPLPTNSRRTHSPAPFDQRSQPRSSVSFHLLGPPPQGPPQTSSSSAQASKPAESHGEYINGQPAPPPSETLEPVTRLSAPVEKKATKKRKQEYLTEIASEACPGPTKYQPTPSEEVGTREHQTTNAAGNERVLTTADTTKPKSKPTTSKDPAQPKRPRGRPPKHLQGHITATEVYAKPTNTKRSKTANKASPKPLTSRSSWAAAPSVSKPLLPPLSPDPSPNAGPVATKSKSPKPEPVNDDVKICGVCGLHTPAQEMTESTRWKDLERKHQKPSEFVKCEKCRQTDHMGCTELKTFPKNKYRCSDDKVVLIDGLSGRSIQYGELKRLIGRFAAGLREHAGFRRGDVVAIFSPNQVDYSVVLFGTLASGGVLQKAKAKILVAHPDNLKIAIEAAKISNLPGHKVFVFGGKEISGIKPYQSIMAKTPMKPVEYTPEECRSTTAFLCFSSGTTGLPKGVETTQFNMMANITQVTEFEKDDTDFKTASYLGVLPFYHIYGLTVLVHAPLYQGAPTIVLPRFELEKTLECIQKYKISMAHIVPPIAVLLAKSPVVKNYDLSSIQMFWSGAAPLSAELSADVRRITGRNIKQGYGMTESSPVSHITPTTKIVDGSIGKLVGGMTAKIVDDNGKEQGVGGIGEIWMAGPNIMKGYLDNPEATADTLDKDGYLHTGDIGYVDKEGYFFIVDRKKELIKYKGFQVAPAEMEGLLMQSPLVADCAVIGVYDSEQATELPRAYVVPTPGNPPNEETAKKIQLFVMERAAQHKKLRGGVKFIDVIPKSASGKILRRVLKDKVKEDEKKRAAAKAKL